MWVVSNFLFISNKTVHIQVFKQILPFSKRLTCLWSQRIPGEKQKNSGQGTRQGEQSKNLENVSLAAGLNGKGGQTHEPEASPCDETHNIPENL